MSGKSIGIFVTLGLSVIFLNSVLADDWDGIICYSGLEANRKICRSCATVYNDCNNIVVLVFL